MNRRYATESFKKRCGGFSVLGWVVIVPAVIVMIILLVFGFYEGRKAYWDGKVGEMCEKDGGGKVLRSIELSKEEYARLYNKFGKFEIPLDGHAAQDAPIVQKQTSTYIRRNDPEVRRDQTVVVRKSNNESLAESVIYSRVGGDLIALHPSYFSCPKKLIDIYSAAVRLSGENK